MSFPDSRRDVCEQINVNFNYEDVQIYVVAMNTN